MVCIYPGRTENVYRLACNSWADVLAFRGRLTSRHHLNHVVVELQSSIEKGEDRSDLFDRLHDELEVEMESLARAFKLFDNSGRGALNKSDVKNMHRYLGFPAEDEDIDQLMERVDKDKSGTIKFDEFETYVGWVGGSSKLFEERQRRLAERLGTEVGYADTETIGAALQQAGLDQEAQAYWRMVVPQTEFSEVGRLVTCQRNAVNHIRRLAKKNHQIALPKLQDRILRMGLREDELWLTLAWIRELAPVIVHINVDKMLKFLQSDTHYRNQFETATSGGLLKPEVRKTWERDLFGGMYDKAEGHERPKYGVQNVMNDYRGVIKCKQYGDSYLILKDSRLRCTFAPEDSANLKSEKLAVLDFYAHVLNEYSEVELRETFRVANQADAAILGDSDKVGAMKYKEAQIHGEVAFDRHVERLVASVRHRDAGLESTLKQVCEMHGWGFSWMDEEQDRMRAESMHKFGGAEWAHRLEALQEGGGDLEVPEGFCRVGCGRRVAPGVTRANRNFTTCCKGCVMGFGHDKLCGTIDPSKVGPGLCKMGCGRPLHPGRDAKGRPLTTCCRGCALGMSHDANCGVADISSMTSSVSLGVAEGMCKMGCGRKVAPGHTPSGKPYTTCCRECATGKGHARLCIG
eukprot:TRINITY_DN24286_c0_g1_i2.p1 TRINITY_DN24286_c0_g1~~TRINITY_DN24286_c0_g1_i2.p1  ORF type:complete len:633 (+),score=109.24 TRINITY_DN24286_c0_g1_i2:119-2017(+)